VDGSVRGGYFYLATSGALLLATSGYFLLAIRGHFLMAMDIPHPDQMSVRECPLDSP